jgi:tetratricopeptide (TPR) repeat protein
MRLTRNAAVLATFLVWSCGATGCTPSQPSGAPAAEPSSTPAAEPPAAAPRETGLYRIRNTAFLQAQRDTSEGFLAASEAFRESLAQKELPNDLINLVRVYVLAETWEGESDRWEEALKAINRYRELVPADAAAEDGVPPDVDYLEGLVLKNLGRLDEAAKKLQSAATRAPEVAAAWFQLASVLLRLRRYQEAIDALTKVLAIAPENTAAYYKIFRAHVFLKNKEEQKKWEKKFNEVSTSAEKVPEKHYEKCRFTRLTLIPQTRRLAEPPTVELSFERAELPSDLALFGARDLAIGAFERDEAAGGQKHVEQVELVGATSLVRLTHAGNQFTVGKKTPLPNATDLTRGTPWDYDNDGRLDLLLTDGSRLRILQGLENGSYKEATETDLVATGVVGALPTDYDHDGDIDVLTLETAATGVVAKIYRNNGDTSFRKLDNVLPGTIGAADAYQLCAVDIDKGNDTDFVLPNRAGAAISQMNLRSGPFRRTEVSGLTGLDLVVSFDLDNDGDMDLVGVPQDGGPVRIARHGGVEGAALLPEFTIAEIPSTADLGRIHDLCPADLDNDGDLDLLIAGSEGLLLLRNEVGGQLRSLPEAVLGELPAASWRRVATSDFDLDCRLDIIALNTDGTPFVWLNRSPTYRAVALSLTGHKDSSTGVGTHIEIYCGQGYQRLRVDEPRRVWVGLGTRSLEEFDGIGLTWPNGLGQAVERDQLTDCRLAVGQRVGLMASCPFLYTHDGTAYRFLTDVIAIAPLDEWLPPGGKPHLDPEEFVRVPARHLKPVDGELRMVITEELRETTYLDRAILLRVVHPEDTVVYTDESTRQGGIEPLRVFVARQNHLRQPRVHAGTLPPDAATERIRTLDGKYLRGFTETHSQWDGWVEPFTIDIELPEELDTKAPALLLTGRIAWYDSATAYSLHQHDRAWLPHRLEVLDEEGSARPILDEVGFPSGMDRTIVAPLAGHLDENSRQLRLTSTHRLLWDRVQLADAVVTAVLTPGTEQEVALGQETCRLRTEALALRTSRLDHRGFSRVVGSMADHTHSYDFSAPTIWRDFPMPSGTATRYGDVEGLVTKTDDQLVVMPPGDAMWLTFDSGTPPGEGQTVTYFLQLTGWAKESAFHVTTGRVIGPLPHGSMKDYRTASDGAPNSAAYMTYLSTFQTRRLGN